jgi:hypothetical protein
MGETPKLQMQDAAEMLWVVLANVSGGDWSKQTPEWQEAAARWRDHYFAVLKMEEMRAAEASHCTCVPVTAAGMMVRDRYCPAHGTPTVKVTVRGSRAPHFWTADSADQNRCAICGDGPWGIHRFQ